jgi:hypothetical protein
VADPFGDLGFGSLPGFDDLGFGGGGSRERDYEAEQEKRIARMREQALLLGLEPEETEPREGLFSKIFNAIDTGKQAVLGLLDSGLIRQDLNKVGFTGAIERGWEERANWFDVLRRENVFGDHAWAPAARGAVGFAGEVLTDPLTYASLGTSALGKGLATAGTKALAPEGLELFTKLKAAKTAEFAGNFRKGDKAADEIMASLGIFKDTLGKIKKTSDPLEREALGQTVARHFPNITDELVGSPNLEKLFLPKALHVGANVPFLGFKGTSFEAPVKLADYVKSLAADAAGPTIKYAQELNDYLAMKPVLGLPSRAGKAGADLTTRFLKGAKDNFNYVFNMKGLLGPEGKAAYEEFALNADAVARLKAEKITTDTFGHVASDPDLRRQTSVILDHAGATALSNFIDDPRYEANFISRINDLVDLKGGDVSESDLASLMKEVRNRFRESSLAKAAIQRKGAAGDVEGTVAAMGRSTQAEGRLAPFGSESFSDVALDHAMDNHFYDTLTRTYDKLGASPELRDVIGRSRGVFDSLHANEAAHGISNNYIQGYVSHIIQNLSAGAKAAGKRGRSDFFTQSRSSRTFGDLITKGYLAETDIAKVLHKRVMGSEKLIAEKQFLERALMEAHTDRNLIMKARKLAVLGNQDAKEFLSSRKFELPKELDHNAAENLLYQSYGRDLDDASSIMKVKNEGILKGAEDLPLDEQMQLADVLARHGDDMLNRAKGMGINVNRPINMKVFGDPGTVVTHFGKEYYLSPTVKDAIEQIAQRRDGIKEFASKNPVTEKLLGVADSMNSWAKRLVTLPWPAYWNQNLIGDGLRRMADRGMGVFNLASYKETHDVLAGKAALKTPSGPMTTAQIKEILESSGIRHSPGEYVGVMDAFENMDIDKLEAHMRSGIDNVKKGELLTGFKKASSKMQYHFEDFMRINQVMHELKKGSSVNGAVRSMESIMFNYRDLSPLEASLFRRFYMFYPWLKKSTGHTLTQLFTNPGSISNQIRAGRGFAEMFSDPQAAPTVDERESELLKDLVGREQVTFPLGTSESGLPVTGRFSGLPVNTLLQSFSLEIPRNFDPGEILDAVGASAVRTVQKQFASANPMIKTAIERISGKSLYFDKPLDSKFLRTVPKLGAVAEKFAPYNFTHIPFGEVTDKFDKEVIEKWLKGVDNGKGGYTVNPGMFHLITSMFPVLGRAVSTGNRFSNEDLDMKRGLLHLLTGIRVDAQDVARTRKSEVEQSLRNQLNSIDAQQQLKNLGYR